MKIYKCLIDKDVTIVGTTDITLINVYFEILVINRKNYLYLFSDIISYTMIYGGGDMPVCIYTR